MYLTDEVGVAVGLLGAQLHSVRSENVLAKLLLGVFEATVELD